MERKASMQLEASSGVELLDEIKSVRFDLRESEDLSEGEQDALGRTSGLFRDDVLGRTSSVPRRVTTTLKPSARADIGGNENLLPSHTTQEDTATSADKGLLPEMGTREGVDPNPSSTNRRKCVVLRNVQRSVYTAAC